ncbi:histidine kinase [Parasphingorhabdus flavimaris]|uniref:Histidine kinase n=1 Tax=Parasphingorhabdus flavimaris TaxID=266812 RepID=A0ABX2N3W1_9SPHN|nr:histidine kinase [Parasphingorhabdus flavimaris]
MKLVSARDLAHDARGQTRSMLDRLFPVNQGIAIKSMFGIWGAYFLFVTSRFLYRMQDNADALFFQRILMTSVCITVTWLLYRLLIAVRRNGMGAAIFMLTLPTIVLANYIAILDQIIFDHDAAMLDFSYLLDPVNLVTFDWAYVLDEAFTRYFILASWGALYLALAHSHDLQRMMVHSRQLEQLNRESELRALRYQLNPHFVFNALNSVSSLIIDRENEQAEKLVDDLADYMRAVLTDGGQDMVAVEQEIAQQVRYLEIERMRFPDRLHYSVDIDPAAKGWSIPALIIQPLIENAVKYGVSGTDRPVNINISAHIEGDRLRITIANDGRVQTGAGIAQDRTAGTGTGLINIQDRLKALYGQNASLLLANNKEGMATATVVLPDPSLIFQDI